MTIKASFDIPANTYQSTEGAIDAYREYWGVPFPGDDADVRYYARLVPSSNSLLKTAPFGTTSRCEHLLWLLRENCGAEKQSVT